MSSLAPKTRIKNPQDFRAVLDGGEKFVCSHCVVLMLKTDHQHSRLGLIVSKKIGNAVARNRVKRRFREVFRSLSQTQNLGSQDVVIIARSFASRRSFAVLLRSVQKAFKVGTDLTS